MEIYRPKTRGHRPGTLAVNTRHCSYYCNPWPDWLMHESAQVIDETLDWDPDDDDNQGGVAAKV